MTHKPQSKNRALRLNERVGYRFSIITKRLNQTLATVHSKQFGVSVNNWKIMSVIAFFGPLSASEVGARTSLDSDKISRAIDSMVRQGHVVRKHDKIDRRRVILNLSAAGSRVHDKIEQQASDLEIGFLSVLTAAERKTLHTALAKLEEFSSVYFKRTSANSARRSLRSVEPIRHKPNVRANRRVLEAG